MKERIRKMLLGLSLCAAAVMAAGCSRDAGSPDFSLYSQAVYAVKGGEKTRIMNNTATVTEMWVAAAGADASPVRIAARGEYTFPETGQYRMYFLTAKDSIGDNAFSFCPSLTSLSLSPAVKAIGNSAFYDCASLCAITFSRGLALIGKSAFTGCASLESAEIPEGVTSIGWSAFSGCASLASVSLPSSLVSLGNSAFARCSSLTSLTSRRVNAIPVQPQTFEGVAQGGVLTVPAGASRYGDWMKREAGNLGSYNWTLKESSDL